MEHSNAQVSAELGIHVVTLYNWRKSWRVQGEVVPASEKDPEGWGSTDKFMVEVDAFYWTVPAPDIVNSGREEQGSLSVDLIGSSASEGAMWPYMAVPHRNRARLISASQPSL
jgi:hypothetical protein